MGGETKNKCDLDVEEREKIQFGFFQFIDVPNKPFMEVLDLITSFVVCT